MGWAVGRTVRTKRQRSLRISWTLSGISRPRPALNAAKRLPRGGTRRRFCNASPAIVPARRAVGCLGPPREGHRAVPTGPAAHLIRVQAHLACGGFKAAFNGPAGARHPHDSLPGGLLGGQDHIRGQLRGGADPAPDQQPAAPVWRQGLGHGQPVPVIPPVDLSCQRPHSAASRWPPAGRPGSF